MALQDAFSKWIELVPLPDKTADTAASAIVTKWIRRFGRMQMLVSDLGREFVNHTMKGIRKLLKVRHQTTSHKSLSLGDMVYYT